VIVLRADWPLATLGRAAQSLWNRVTRDRRPVTGLDTRLLAERDTIRAVLGRNWRQAAILTAGRLGFDYGCLLAALRATGASPQPSLVLLAYAAAGIVALFPVTPGGLGIVEGSLSGLLVLAGVRAGYAVLAILAYRISSYWLPCWPARRPTCCSAAVTGARSPGAPRHRPAAGRRNSSGRTSSPQRCISPGPSGTPASSGA
jgi:lysylphosphatidylglycerol synthase-like protein